MTYRTLLPSMAVGFLLAFAVTGNTVRAADHPTLTKEQQKKVRKIHNNFELTYGHPDLYGQYRGVEEFSRGEYLKAMKDFKYGARYADKMSQMCIGLMYLNGRGVDSNPVTAWAWISLASERGYPMFVTTRDRVWSTLDKTQRKQAKDLRATLALTYADKVAKPRMVHMLHYRAPPITGSHLRYDGGVGYASIGKGGINTGMGGFSAHCGTGTDGLSATCNDALVSSSRWDPHDYFADKDSRWMSTVSVGAATPDDPADKSDKSDKSDKPAASSQPSH